ncbi:MAG: aryl-sulfate sulfotransferase [Pseudomonadota bacterium]|nr:aryl-sulfate sulfotransferase [Pseudomonadota bacterium]
MSLFIRPPEIKQNPNKRVPLVALVYFETELPVTITIDVTNGHKDWQLKFNENYDPTKGLPIVGMRADTKYRIVLTVVSHKGETDDSFELTYRTPKLPDDTVDMPEVKLILANASAMEAGFTILSIRRSSLTRDHWATPKQAEFEKGWGLIAAFDEEGQVVWTYHSDSRIAGIHQLKSGNLFFHYVDFRTVEIDICGNIVRQFHAGKRPFGPVENSTPIDAESLHHQPHEMENGNFLALTANSREIENYYTDIIDKNAPRKTQNVVGDNIVEFTPEGEIVWNWNTFDHLDVERVGYGLLEPYWWVRGFPGALDWTHGNGVTNDPYDGNILVSLRHQDAILKIDKESGKIIWILGDHQDWSSEYKSKLLRPIDDLIWPYHGHNPRVTGPNKFIMYDNGIIGTLPPHPRKKPVDCLARAVEFEVDAESMEVRQIWSSAKYDTKAPVVSFAMGDAHRLSNTGNVMVIDSICAPRREILSNSGKLTWDDVEWRLASRDSWHPVDFPTWVRVREYAGKNNEKVVFELNLLDKNEIINWAVFGGLRITSFYPPEIDVQFKPSS